MPLDVLPLAKAATRLEEGLIRFREDESDAQIRDGLIQRFEFTYDLAHRTLRRALEEVSSNPQELDHLTFPALIRAGVDQGLLAGEWAMWSTWREVRMISPQSHDEAKGVYVVAAIPAFLAEVQGMLERLQTRQQAVE